MIKDPPPMNLYADAWAIADNYSKAAEHAWPSKRGARLKQAAYEWRRLAQAFRSN